MTPLVADNFALQHAIDQAESVTRFLSTRRPEQAAPSLDAVVRAGVEVGEALPHNWRVAFNNLLRVGDDSWCTVGEYEAVRNAVRRLFFTAREAMDQARRFAEALQAQTGRQAEGMDRLLEVIEDARRLEEGVFRDWPSFAEPLPPVNFAETLSAEESLAALLGITVDQAREKLEARKRELDAQGQG